MNATLLFKIFKYPLIFVQLAEFLATSKTDNECHKVFLGTKMVDKVIHVCRSTSAIFRVQNQLTRDYLQITAQLYFIE